MKRASLPLHTTARLESLTKDYECVLILSRAAAQAAGINLVGHQPRQALVKGRAETIEFYALKAVPQAAL